MRNKLDKTMDTTEVLIGDRNGTIFASVVPENAGTIFNAEEAEAGNVAPPSAGKMIIA